MKSYKSFDELLKEEPRIENILLNSEKYFAHTHKKRAKEKLHEHVHLVMEYALKLVNVHGLDTVIDNMINELINSYGKIVDIEKVGNFIKNLFVNALVYHDYGKVNENFQIDKMQDEDFFKRNDNNKIGSQHSILSAYVFLNVHLNKILDDETLSKTDRNLLAISTFLFANPILKHHSSFFEHQPNFEKEVINSLEQYLYLFKTDLTPSVRRYLEVKKKIFEKFPNMYSAKNEDYFSFFALLKLNFSLLTASDYYATNDFMGDMPVNDFGLIDQDFKEKLIASFINNRKVPYNGDLIRRIDYYNQLDFSILQERNHTNLNELRQKIAAEAITTLRQNIDEKLFYLEAPTGGGKTNMSIACTLELLNADKRLNKVFYVFPFTTLITQTFKSIKETLQIDDDNVIQLHSKGGFHTSEKEVNQDGLYGDKKLNYINNLFINYPFTLLSHVKFFDIVKGNIKDSNYILHRLSNSIVIIDELQTYTPKHWDKIIFFLHNYAKHFNIRFIIMSATLPKIDTLSKDAKGKVISLIPNKPKYFTNPNFKDRVSFDFSLLGSSGRDTIKLDALLNTVHQELENFATTNDNSANGLIEFIIKKSASNFYQLLEKSERFKSYQKFLISGTILEPRRKEVIKAIKEKVYRGTPFKKSIIVSTQVVEAGVDIDMDLGFKDRSLVDSDEQLAGRINRNASKSNCKVFIFNYDREAKIYGKDKRYEQQLSKADYEAILNDKDFDKLYDKVNIDINKTNENEHFVNIKDYLNYFKRFDFRNINEKFKLIDTNTTSVFVPLDLDCKLFTVNELDFLGIYDAQKVSGEYVFDIYNNIISGKGDFITKAIDKKQIAGIMSKYMFSIFSDSKLNQQLLTFSDLDSDTFENFGLLYLSDWKNIYSYEDGLIDSMIDDPLNQIF